MGDLSSVGKADAKTSQFSLLDDILPILKWYSVFEERDVVSLACTCKDAAGAVEGIGIYFKVYEDPVTEYFGTEEDQTHFETPLPNSVVLLKTKVVSLEIDGELDLTGPATVKCILERCASTLQVVKIDQMQTTKDRLGSSVLPWIPNLKEFVVKRCFSPEDGNQPPTFDFSQCIPASIETFELQHSSFTFHIAEPCNVVLPFISPSRDVVNKYKELRSLHLENVRLQYLHHWNLPPNLEHLHLRTVSSPDEIYDKKSIVWPSKMTSLCLCDTDCKGLNADALTSLLDSHCNSLQSLSLDRWSNFTRFSKLQSLSLSRVNFGTLPAPGFNKVELDTLLVPASVKHLEITMVIGLIRVCIPPNVSEVYVESCDDLENISFSGTKVEKLDVEFCKSLRHLILPDGLKEIELCNVPIKELILPDGLKEIELCNVPIKEISLPKTVQKCCIGGCYDLEIISFSGAKVEKLNVARCESLRHLILPDGLEEIHLRDLPIAELILPDDVEEIDLHNLAITELILPDGVEEIDLGHLPITEISLPKAVQKCCIWACDDLGNISFSGVKVETLTVHLCTSLHHLILPDGLKEIHLCELPITEISLPKTVHKCHMWGLDHLVSIEAEPRIIAVPDDHDYEPTDFVINVEDIIVRKLPWSKPTIRSPSSSPSSHDEASEEESLDEW